MTPDSLLEVLNGVEAGYPVSDWSIGDIRVWPLIRNRSFRYNEAERARASSSRSASRGRHLRAAAGVVRGAVHASWASRTDRRNAVHRRPPPADLLLLSDSVSRVFVSGTWYDRFCDPIVEAAAELGLRTVQLEPHHRYRTPRAHPSRYVQPGMDLLELATRIAPPRPSQHLDGWPEALADLAAAGVPSIALDHASLVREAVLVERQAQRFGRFFAAVRPRLALHVDYGTSALAFTLAARRFGLSSTELQHTIPPTTHAMYASWNQVPHGGYELLPGAYWTWNESAASVLRGWTAGVVDGPQVVMGGNPWLERWLSGQGDVVRAYDEKYFENSARRTGRRQVLLTFETTFTAPAIVDPILDAAVATRGSADWWYRMHPTTPRSESTRLRRVLAERGLDPPGADVTAEPLYALLRHVDVHVTHASGTANEAALFGVPTVLTSDANSSYADLLSSGWATVASSGADLAAAVMAVRPPEGTAAGRGAPPLAVTLQRLLGDPRPPDRPCNGGMP